MTRARRGAPGAIMSGSQSSLAASATTIVAVDADRPLHAECAALISERFQGGIDVLAESIGTDGERLQNFLAGNCNISAAVLVAMSSRLRCDLKFLIGRQQIATARVMDEDEVRAQPHAVPRRAVPPQPHAVPRRAVQPQPTAATTRPPPPPPPPEPLPVETVEPEKPESEPMMEDLEIEPETESPVVAKPPARLAKKKPLSDEQRAKQRFYYERAAREKQKRAMQILKEFGAR